MKILPLLLLLVACTTPQLEPEQPFVPEQAREVTEQVTAEETTAKEMLDSLFMTQPPDEYSLTIKITSHVNDTDHVAEVTQYVSHSNLRTHTTQRIDGKDIAFDTFIIDGEFHSCVFDEEWDCRPAPEEPMDPQAFPEPVFEEPVVTQLSSKFVAGLSAQCFELKYRESMEELCLTESGIVVYRHVIFGNEYITEEAQQLSMDVAQDVFVLPSQ